VKIKISLCFALLFTLSSVNNTFALDHNDVTPQEAKNMIDSNEELIVIDVREDYEYCAIDGHIPGAFNYPWSSGVLQQRYEELPRDGEILVYCRSGYRSNLAANFLDDNGFFHIYDMLGGFSDWLWETAGCVDSDGDSVRGSGGIIGGISTGMPIEFTVAVKPTASIGIPQKTVNINTKKNIEVEFSGRHDPCIVPRVIPVIESITAIVLLDCLLIEGFIPRVIESKKP